MLKDGSISAGHARALLGLNDEEQMIECAAKITERGMSVRDVEAMVQRLNAIREEQVEERVHPQIKAHMKELEHRAMSALGRKLRISRSTHKKVLELTYSDDEDLEALLRSLCGDNIFEEVAQ